MGETITLFVAAGHTVQVGEWIPGVPPERRGPGQTVSLPREEAERLRGLGFLQDTPPTIAPPGPPNPAAIGPHSWQGPSYDRNEPTPQHFPGPVYVQQEQR
jgi:hypothetical protein